ncbi:capsule assembly Wzi family protein [Treponema primitia]|uniref:capsule assembly Wzi family protein n=1 Tax=Treponema primitia TaxID=88058 RepID=UPI00397E91BE
MELIMIYRYKFICFFTFLIFSFKISAQEVLLSDNERFYDFLALQGIVERPYLNFRTLSDSIWIIDKDVIHPWTSLNLGKKRVLNNDIFMRIYDTELFTSYNSSIPYGQNDGALWQGKGINSSITGGVRFEGYGIEFTFKPQISFSQNLNFNYITPAYVSNSDYDFSNKADRFGDYGVKYIDAPQRFGDEPFFIYDWGDSEIRYVWKTITIGFGTESIWLGPARINPIIHSNNAPTYPKLDLGVRKQPVTIPKLNWYIGDIEARAWWGYLSESEYFDNDTSNDHNLITGFSFSYAPSSLLKGLTIGINRIMLTKWDEFDFTGIFDLLNPLMQSSSTGYDERDQRASMVFSYLFPSVGFELYFEWARNDGTGSGIYGLIRNPFHTQAFTLGGRKNIIFNSAFQGELLVEITNLESTREYEFAYPTTFYAHHIITQGHTNRGQWIGSGSGSGGNSQYLGFTLFYKKGYSALFIQREGINNDYLWFRKFDEPLSEKFEEDYNFKAFLSFGINNYLNIYSHFGLFSSIVYTEIINPTYDHHNKYDMNFRASIGVKYIF